MVHKKPHTRNTLKSSHLKTGQNLSNDKKSGVEYPDPDVCEFLLACRSCDEIIKLHTKDKQLKTNKWKNLKRWLKQGENKILNLLVQIIFMI